MSQPTWKQVVTGAFALTLVIASATFQITKLSCDNLVAQLYLQIERIDRLNDQLQRELDDCKPQLTDTGQKHSGNDDNLKIDFTQPKNGDLVGKFINVQYAIQPGLPKGYRAILFVQDPLGQYWSWGASPTLRHGRHVRVQIGTAADQGKDFKLGVLITQADVSLGEVAQALPDGIKYECITVTRK